MDFIDFMDSAWWDVSSSDNVRCVFCFSLSFRFDDKIEDDGGDVEGEDVVEGEVKGNKNLKTLIQGLFQVPQRVTDSILGHHAVETPQRSPRKSTLNLTLTLP